MIAAGIILIGIGLYVLTLVNETLSLTLALIPTAFFVISGLIVIGYGIRNKLKEKKDRTGNGQ